MFRFNVCALTGWNENAGFAGSFFAGIESNKFLTSDSVACGSISPTITRMALLGEYQSL